MSEGTGVRQGSLGYPKAFFSSDDIAEWWFVMNFAWFLAFCVPNGNDDAQTM